MENTLSPDTIGPTVVYAAFMLQDGGAKTALGVVFKDSGYRHALRAGSLPEAVEKMRAFVAEAPYGVNRYGQAWVPRNG